MTDMLRDEQGRTYIVGPNGERFYSSAAEAVDHGPFTDTDGSSYFLDNDGNRYIPDEVAVPLYYSCEHGESNVPDACILRVYPNAVEAPVDWFTHRWAPYLAAPAETMLKLAEKFAEDDREAAKAGTLDSATIG